MRAGFRRVRVALMSTVFVVALNGCSKSNTPSPETRVSLEDQWHDWQPAKIGGPMPASLHEVYKNAEQVFEAVSSVEWTAGAVLTALLKRSFAQFRADLNPITSANDVRAGVVAGKLDLIASYLDLLENAIRAHDRESAKLESNRITMPIAELAGMYAPSGPGELMMLKYYSREFDIAASTDDTPSLKEIADDVRRTWSGLRPAVEAKGGLAEARQFNDLTVDLEKSGTPGQIGSLLRDRIDEIQEVLKR